MADAIELRAKIVEALKGTNGICLCIKGCKRATTVRPIWWHTQDHRAGLCASCRAPDASTLIHAVWADLYNPETRVLNIPFVRHDTPLEAGSEIEMLFRVVHERYATRQE